MGGVRGGPVFTYLDIFRISRTVLLYPDLQDYAALVQTDQIRTSDGMTPSMTRGQFTAFRFEHPDQAWRSVP